MHPPELAIAPSPVAPRIRPRLRTAGIIGFGRALPATIVENEPIAERIGVDPSWITKRTGISARRRADTESLSDLAIEAGRRALAAAGVNPAYVDAVLVATSSADDIVPQAAPMVAGGLGADRAMAWDVGLACTGFLAGLQQGAALIESGRANTVLLIGADVLGGRYTDDDDRQTSALFGDGAGAAVLAPGGPARIADVVLGASAQRDVLYIDRTENVVRMEGRLVYQQAIDHMERSCRELLALAQLDIDDVDLVIAHQANGRIINAVRERFGLEPDRVADYVSDLGNTSAASIPLALSLAEDDRRLPGERGNVLLTAFGAGFSWGAALLTYGRENA